MKEINPRLVPVNWMLCLEYQAVEVLFFLLLLLLSPRLCRISPLHHASLSPIITQALPVLIIFSVQGLLKYCCDPVSLKLHQRHPELPLRNKSGTGRRDGGVVVEPMRGF